MQMPPGLDMSGLIADFASASLPFVTVGVIIFIGCVALNLSRKQR